MPRGVRFTQQKKRVLSEIMKAAWARKRGRPYAPKRMRISNPSSTEHLKQFRAEYRKYLFFLRMRGMVPETQKQYKRALREMDNLKKMGVEDSTIDKIAKECERL